MESWNSILVNCLSEIFWSLIVDGMCYSFLGFSVFFFCPFLHLLCMQHVQWKRAEGESWEERVPLAGVFIYLLLKYKGRRLAPA